MFWPFDVSGGFSWYFIFCGNWKSCVSVNYLFPKFLNFSFSFRLQISLHKKVLNNVKDLIVTMFLVELHEWYGFWTDHFWLFISMFPNRFYNSIFFGYPTICPPPNSSILWNKTSNFSCLVSCIIIYPRFSRSISRIFNHFSSYLCHEPWSQE